MNTRLKKKSQVIFVVMMALLLILVLQGCKSSTTTEETDTDTVGTVQPVESAEDTATVQTTLATQPTTQAGDTPPPPVPSDTVVESNVATAPYTELMTDPITTPMTDPITEPVTEPEEANPPEPAVLLDRTGWSATSPSPAYDAPNAIENIFDGDAATNWMSVQLKWLSFDHHELVVIFPETTTVSVLELLPRQEDANGRFQQIRIMASATADGNDFVLIRDGIAFQDVENDASSQLVSLEANISVRRIKIVVTAGMWTFASLAEFNAYGHDGSLEDKTSDFFGDPKPETKPAETEPIPPLETGTARLFALAPEPNSLMQSFVIRTENGKLIVIDGGIEGEGQNAKAYMPAALRAIAGVGQTDLVEVEAWILSHAHLDHYGELTKTLTEYANDENFVIKQFIFDFPDFGSTEYPTAHSGQSYLDLLKNAMNAFAEARELPITNGSTYYDDVNGAFANAASIAEGCELEIDGIRLEFLQTWRKEDGTNINNNSLVMRAWVEGQSILFLQDTAVERGMTLVDTYGDAIKSDIVQMAHHGQGGVDKAAYDAIAAKVRIWNTPIWVWNDPGRYEIGATREWVHGGEEFTASSEWDIVTCLYEKYPTTPTSMSSWAAVLAYQSIPLPYTSVATAPNYNAPEDDTDTPAGPDYKSENPVNFVGTFTNFDTMTELDATAAPDGTTSGDFYLYDSAATSVSLAAGKGYNGSNALQITTTSNANQVMHLYATDENKNVTDYPYTKYLRVWVDFTGLDFRKASFGLINEKGEIFRTDEKDFEYPPLYCLPEGETKWQILTIGEDGCFGQAQGPSVLNFKGWLAFSTSDFLYKTDSGNGESVKGDSFGGTTISGLYFYWSYAQNADHTGKSFYLDEIQLVKDYTVFEDYTID